MSSPVRRYASLLSRAAAMGVSGKMPLRNGRYRSRMSVSCGVSVLNESEIGRTRLNSSHDCISYAVFCLKKNLFLDIAYLFRIVVDRFLAKEENRSRISEAVELAVAHGDGLVTVNIDGKEDKIFSTSLSCPEHGVSLGELEPRMFSFNNPYGECDSCSGLGCLQKIDP